MVITCNRCTHFILLQLIFRKILLIQNHYVDHLSKYWLDKGLRIVLLSFLSKSWCFANQQQDPKWSYQSPNLTRLSLLRTSDSAQHKHNCETQGGYYIINDSITADKTVVATSCISFSWKHLPLWLWFLQSAVLWQNKN